jgi:NAD(P)-dependent dehydrogenase (short-subunit alcohol dehydrogenase family)
MAPVIVVAGYGPGISAAVAESFAKKGFSVALLARTQAKLDAAAAGLKAAHGIEAKGFAVDLVDADVVKATIAKIHDELGTITVLYWNPYGRLAGILDGTTKDYVGNFNVTTSSLIAAVQAAYADLKSQPGVSAVLVTGGNLSLEVPAITQMTVDWNAATLAVGKAAQRKTVDLMHVTLAKDDIYVGEVTVMTVVKGTPFEKVGNATLTGEDVAAKVVDLYAARSPTFVAIP